MKNKNNLLTVSYLIGIALVDFMGLGVVVTLFPKLLLEADSLLLPLSWSNSLRLTALGVFLAIYPLGQFFGAAVLGKLSDRFGRRRLLLLTLTGTLLGFLASGWALVIASPLLLFFSRLFSGLFSGNIAVVQASLADISPDEATKNRYFSWFQVALGLSWVIGPPMGGWLSDNTLVDWFTYTTPFWITCGFLSVLLLVTQCWFKETASLVTPKSTQKCSGCSLFSGIREIKQAFLSPHLRLLFLAWFVLVSGWWLFEAFLPTYLLRNFHYTPAQIGNFLASMGATYALFQCLVVQRFSKMKPATMVKGFLVLSGLSVIALDFVHTELLLHAVITVFVTSMGFAMPGLIVSVSSQARPEEQGQVMGMVSSIQAIATVLMMGIGGWLQSFSVNTTVIGGGALLILSWLVFTASYSNRKSMASPVPSIESSTEAL